MFDGRWRDAVDRGTGPVGRKLYQIGITADMLTATGLVSAAATAVAIGSGHLHLAIILLSITGLHDLLDGPVAKAAGTASVRGAFFDSVTDRVADVLVLGGVAWYLEAHRGGHDALVPFAILGATTLVSYERAKAESLGIEARGGLMERGGADDPARCRFPLHLAADAGALDPARTDHGHRSRTVRQGVASRRGTRDVGSPPTPADSYRREGAASCGLAVAVACPPAGRADQPVRPDLASPSRPTVTASARRPSRHLTKPPPHPWCSREQGACRLPHLYDARPMPRGLARARRTRSRQPRR